MRVCLLKDDECVILSCGLVRGSSGVGYEHVLAIPRELIQTMGKLYE